MKHIRNLEIDAEVGYFHKVTAVGVGENVVSIISNNTEFLLNYLPQPGVAISTFGMFGDLKAAGGQMLEGIRIFSVTQISVQDPFNDPRDWRFQRKLLTLKTHFGLNYCWTLYCRSDEE